MKLWAAMPENPLQLRGGASYYCRYSSAAMCPPMTLEMEQDGLRWFEIEVVRKMPKSSFLSRAPLSHGWDYGA